MLPMTVQFVPVGMGARFIRCRAVRHKFAKKSAVGIADKARTKYFNLTATKPIELSTHDMVYSYEMVGTRAFFAVLLSFALFVQGVAASTTRSCHIRTVMVEQSGQHASHQHAHDAPDAFAEMTDMSMAPHRHDQNAASTHHHDDSDKSKSSKLTSCAWCAACCMNLALPVLGVTSPELFPGARTVFPPLAVAPPSRLPGGWDRPPRA